jgi:hypothetical protein
VGKEAKVIGQDLQRHVTLQARVTGAIYLPHAAKPE